MPGREVSVMGGGGGGRGEGGSIWASVLKCVFILQKVIYRINEITELVYQYPVDITSEALNYAS